MPDFEFRFLVIFFALAFVNHAALAEAADDGQAFPYWGVGRKSRRLYPQSGPTSVRHSARIHPPNPSSLIRLIRRCYCCCRRRPDSMYQLALPPLLGVAYVVLGGILPRIMENIIVVPMQRVFNSQGNRNDVRAKPTSQQQLQARAIIAVATTALIIKLSELLQAQSLPLLPDGSNPDSEQSLAIMLFAALSQWLLLDGTPAALLAASITSIGGPLSELPFVAGGFWHYIPSAADYLPLASLPESGGGLLDSLAKAFLGNGYRDLALSSITGPCYFAVTMDSIALGRWFDAQDGEDEI